MSTREKTLIRTVRIPKALDTLFRKDAKTKRITVNALISSIMTNTPNGTDTMRDLA